MKWSTPSGCKDMLEFMAKTHFLYRTLTFKGNHTFHKLYFKALVKSVKSCLSFNGSEYRNCLKIEPNEQESFYKRFLLFRKFQRKINVRKSNRKALEKFFEYCRRQIDNYRFNLFSEFLRFFSPFLSIIFNLFPHHIENR